MFFKKKKDDSIRVMHYEGIDGFATDYPCTLKLDDEMLVIKRIKPETTVTLPRDRIKSISAMQEKNFMMKYHGNEGTTNKGKIGKSYLVIEYDKGFLAFWGTAGEGRKFIKMQYDFGNETNIEL